MSDEKPTNIVLPDPPAEETRTLTITYYPESGRIMVEGPIDDQLMSFGMLRIAEHQIIRHNERKQRELEKISKGLYIPGMVPGPGFKLPGQ